MTPHIPPIPPTFDRKFCMKGTVRRNRQKFYIDLHFRGERIHLFSDKKGSPFSSERQAGEYPWM